MIHSMFRAPALGILAGLLAPLLFGVAVVFLTLHEWTYLREHGWSAVHRTAVEWPSVLALGPDGWLFSVTLVATGMLGFAFAFTLRRLAPTRGVAPALLALVALTTMVEALRANHPRESSWHGNIHALVYPLIPIGAIAAAAVLAVVLRDTLRQAARLSSGAALVMVSAATAGFVASVAQLARFVLFGAFLTWLATLALLVAVNSDRRRAGSSSSTN